MTQIIQSQAPVLQVRDLEVAYSRDGELYPAVSEISFELHPGKTLALVGESGSGKTTIGQALIGLLSSNGSITGGSVKLSTDEGAIELRELSERQFRTIRGRRIGLIPQDPNNSLNPVKKIGESVAEALEIHKWADKAKIRERVLELLTRVGIDDPQLRVGQYPHELSGGQRQRVLIAAAIALSPDVIIADEPTSALDVTVQRRVLDLIDELRAEINSAVLFITHDLPVAAERADEVMVLRSGAIQELGATVDILRQPKSEYTQRLLHNTPSFTQPVSRPIKETETYLDVVNLSHVYGAKDSAKKAVDNVGFSVRRGTTHALVGESGSGKTTVGRSIAGFIAPSSGQIIVGGKEINAGKIKKDFRRKVQLVYQNPYGSLDPRQRIADIIAEPLRNFGRPSKAILKKEVTRLLDLVALPADFAYRRPRELSGGQRQRVAIARALILEPELVVLDEAVSALDVTVQAQILELLAQLQEELDLTYVFISHDLAVVRQVADTVSVLNQGKQVDFGTTTEIFSQPNSEYTQALLDAIPAPMQI